MDDLTLREATAEDASFLVALARAAYQEVLMAQFHGWDEAVHGKRYAEKIASLPFEIVELNGERVGTVSASIHSDHLRVDELVVLPAFQNRGIGESLIRRAIERARSLGLPVRLHTFRLNRALRFYERHGFVVTARGDVNIHLECH